MFCYIADVKIVYATGERSSTGILEWETNSDAIDALVVANHTPLGNPSS